MLQTLWGVPGVSVHEVLAAGWGSWLELSCGGDSATVVLSLAFTVLGAKGVGRNQSPSLY